MSGCGRSWVSQLLRRNRIGTGVAFLPIFVIGSVRERKVSLTCVVVVLSVVAVVVVGLLVVVEVVGRSGVGRRGVGR